MSERHSMEAGMPLDEEQCLVLAARNGDQKAFEKLYNKYNPKICRHVKSFVRHDAITSELVQDTFETAWKSLPGLHASSCFSAWLFRIATNLANNYLKRRKKILFISLEDWHEQGGEAAIGGPENRAANEELLQQALACVNPTYRSCFILYHIEEFSQKEIANIVQMKEAHVSIYVSRGAEQFRKAYSRLSQPPKERHS